MKAIVEPKRASFFLSSLFTFQFHLLEILPSATFWASRGHRFQVSSLLPTVRAFILIAYNEVSAFPLFSFICTLIDFHRFLLLITHARALSAINT